MVVPKLSEAGLTVIIGVAAGFTSALNPTISVVAPGLVLLIVPAKTPSPVAPAALMRTLMVVAASVPFVGVSVSEE